MNKKLETLVLEIAHDVRQWTERKDKKRSEPTKNLCGWCAIAAGKLYRQLCEEGIPSYLAMSQTGWGCHVFNIVDDHVLDVTATQFSEFANQRVVLLHEKEAEAYEFYQVEQLFGCNRELRRAQLNAKWPRSQVAYDVYD